ncbi:MAG: HD domain-containing protein [Oscillospiraceae bacterium]|nr:HD domain-containing protein [Oscillospiraceae bacterium]
MVTFADVKKNEEIKIYIQNADQSMEALGYTEHAFAHVTKTAVLAGSLLKDLGQDARTVELGEIAGYMHDIGNLVNRSDHAHSGALMAFRLLKDMGMDPKEVAIVMAAIGNHDESTGFPVNAVAAAIILADKSDVRRSRVRCREAIAQDIHDRVNYAVEDSSLSLNVDAGAVVLKLTIDTEICPVMEYFEIFLDRMLLCRRAAAFFSLNFGLIINELKLL